MQHKTGGHVLLTFTSFIMLHFESSRPTKAGEQKKAVVGNAVIRRQFAFQTIFLLRKPYSYQILKMNANAWVDIL